MTVGFGLLAIISSGGSAVATSILAGEAILSLNTWLYCRVG